MSLETLNKVAYTTEATAKGGRDGSVTSKDGVIDLPLARPGNFSGVPKANPETLFAAGYAACFGGALNMVAKREGLDTSDSTVTADVSFGETDSGFGLAVELVASIPGVERARAQELLEKAHQVCPYSKATRGNIDVNLRVAE